MVGADNFLAGVGWEVVVWIVVGLMVVVGIVLFEKLLDGFGAFWEAVERKFGRNLREPPEA